MKPIGIRYMTVAIAFAAICLCTCSVTADSAKAAWTVMIYMNAKNNLEDEALNNFRAIAAIGSSVDVSVVVELGRPRQHYSCDYGGWSGVRRFLVRKDDTPASPAAADAGDADMASGAELAAFIKWTRRFHPATHYFLVVWDHGQGWRLTRTRPGQAGCTMAVPESARVQGHRRRQKTGLMRSISSDDDTHNVMYNSELQEAVQQVIGTDRLDLLGFDACLMEMLETAYAMKHIAHFMVGSEEEEPGAGWNYRAVLGGLVQHPEWSREELAKAVVRAYKEEYGDDQLTTLSALDLAEVPFLARQVSALSRSALAGGPEVYAPIRAAREKCPAYGEMDDLRTSIDLGCIVTGINSNSTLERLHPAAQAVRMAIDRVVVANYCSEGSKRYGSTGIALYFPISRVDFDRDAPDSQGYLPENQSKPVEFVQKEDWARFLASYLRAYP